MVCGVLERGRRPLRLGLSARRPFADRTRIFVGVFRASRCETKHISIAWIIQYIASSGLEQYTNTDTHIVAVKQTNTHIKHSNNHFNRRRDRSRSSSQSSYSRDRVRVLIVVGWRDVVEAGTMLESSGSRSP